MPDISSNDLLRLLTTDEPLQDWVADSVGLPPARLRLVPHDQWAAELDCEFPWLSLGAEHDGHLCMIHIVVAAPDELHSAMGSDAMRRAAFLHEAHSPLKHTDFRIALLTLGDAENAGDLFPNVILAEDLSTRLRKVVAA